MESHYSLQELAFLYGETPEWEHQLALFTLDSILYLEEYPILSDDIYVWESDEDLHPASRLLQTFAEEKKQERPAVERIAAQVLSEKAEFCVGIGTYSADGNRKLYMCVILDSRTRKVEAYSFGVYRSVDLVRKALDNFFRLWDGRGNRIVLQCSRNPIYRCQKYRNILEEYPVEGRMNIPGSRGQSAAVSTFFSGLMQKKGKMPFGSRQDAIDWLSVYILKYNLKRTGNGPDSSELLHGHINSK